MHERLLKRAIAVLLVLCMCLSCFPSLAFAEEGEEETRSWTGTEEQTLEDASAQLGEYTPPAADSEQEAEPPAEEPAAEPEAPETEPAAEPAAPAESDPEEAGEEDTRGLNRSPVSNEGRAFAGQVVLDATRIRDGEIEEVQYLLIGTKQQLIALDTYPTVQTATSSASATELTERQRPNAMGPIWRLNETKAGGVGQSWVVQSYELVYPGDADLRDGIVINSDGDTKDFSGYLLYGMYNDNDGGIYGPNDGGTSGDRGKKLGYSNTESHIGTDYRTRYVGGTLDAYDDTITDYNYPKYANTGDYVIFRDIDLNGTNWVPLMFYGTMLGIVGEELDTSIVPTPAEGEDPICALAAAVNKMNRSARSEEYADTLHQPEIAHVTVNQTAQMDITKYTGVGFFATVSSARPGTASLVNANVKAEVRNLKLTDISVDNSSAGMKLDTTLVSSLTGFLGGGLGVVLDALLTVLLGKETHFTDSLNALLDARRKDPTNMATGAFAGKVDGDVLIENCDLVNVTLHSNYAYVGGFVGYSSGIVQYDGLSAGLDAVLKILTNLLNSIPGLGLGDLVAIVKQVLPLNNLIPVGYYNPYILDCDVNNLHGPNNAPIGSMTYAWEGDTAGVTIQKETEYVGGFIGCKIATVMINDSITDSSYSLRGTRYVGGFAGMARDAVIQELLTDLGVDLGVMKGITERLADANVNLQSVQVRCNLNDDDITINGTEYLGGFNGAMCNAYCINNEVNCSGNSLTVTGTGDHVGGFAGFATLGYPMSLGSTAENESLLTTLNEVVTSLVSSYGDSLLNLMGVGQSEILGLQFDFGQASANGEEVTVSGNDFVGGLVGKADALIMGGATEENLEKITYIQDGDLTAKDLFPDTTGGSSLTVTFVKPCTHDTDNDGEADHPYDIHGTPASVAFGTSVSMPDAPTNVPTGYTFVGWVTSDYHEADTKPVKIYKPADNSDPDNPVDADKYIVTRDMTFRALYERPSEYVYELLSMAPESVKDWEGDYVITHVIGGASGIGDESNIILLTGLTDDSLTNSTDYESVDSNGHTWLTDEPAITLKGVVLRNVPAQYVFTVDRYLLEQNVTIENENKDTYVQIARLGSHHLEAESIADAASYKWKLSMNPDGINVIVHSDTSTASLTYPYYLVPHYVTSGSGAEQTRTFQYFKSGTETEANATVTITEGDTTKTLVQNGMFFWKKTMDGPYYDTFTLGSDLSVTVTGKVYDNINVRGLKDVSGRKFVGGLVGYADTASVGSLIGDTAGIAKFEVFDFSDLIVDRNQPSPNAEPGATFGTSTGLTVTASDYYAGGGIGMAMGGKVTNVAQYELISVRGKNCAGGFIGCMGPGSLAGTGGLDVSLFGVSVLSANNLLSLAEGLETSLNHVTVTGVDAGYTVEATGTNVGSEQVVYCAGGFFGRANSAIAEDCHAVRVRWVKANDTDGRAGGFIGVSQVGGLADVAGSGGEGLDALRSDGAGSLLQASDLLGAVGYLIPSYTNVDVRFINDSYVKGAYAGGFAADFESGTVDNSDKDEGGWYAVYNIDRVEGTLYAGGFGGKVYSGALADAAGGISVLGGVSNISITAKNLLDLVNYYIPKILYAGVNSSSDTKYEFDAQNPGPADLHNGLIVSVSGSSAMDSKSGAAGGFIGYGSGAEVSYSDVTYLRHTEVTPPAELEGKDGSSYYNTKQSSYAVTSTRYAGGYIGYMDIGSTASLGGGLGILGNNLSLTNVLDALSIVSTTIEHSDVNGALGGFAVLSGAAETGPSGGSKGLNRDGSDIIKVYVQDNTTTSDQDFRYYIFNSSNQQHPTDWPGSKPTHFGVTEDGKNVYWFEVDAALYDRVIFTDGTYQTSDDYCLKLDHSSLSLADGIATVSNNPTSDHGWEVHYDVSDITVVKTHESCRGSYKYYNSARGVKSYVETVTNENGEHSFGDWTSVAGERRHYHECATCAYREYEDCAVASWTPIEGQNNHEGDCAKCGQHLSEACTFVAGSDHCSVCGQRSVTAEAYNVGRSGGFAGWIRGGQIQDSDCNLFSYIVGQVAAGGYAGEIEPGSVADVLGNTTVLGGLVSTESSLLSLAKGFVTTIRNSETTCIPCGGAVRADAFSDANTQRGMAGGYVGHNCGGQIWGNNTSAWKEEYDHSAANQDNNGDIISYAYTGYTKECAAIRILSVYGAEYAGGFTGLMESANTADTGSLSLLWGLIDAHNVLGALSIVYPTEENTAVYGPLYGVTQAQWDGWLAFVGQYGGYGMGMKPLSGLTLEVDGNTISYEDMTAEQKDTAFENMLKQYLYGYHVAAGRDEYSTEAIQVKGGYAGGYVGAMRTGTITNGQAWNAKQVTAMHAAGGFAGEMSAGGAAELGSVNILGLGLDLTNLLSVMNVFVPCVKESSVHGYQSGLTVCAFGAKNNNSINKFNLTHRLGDAGGYVGAVSGGQIWGDPDATAEGETVERGCNVYNLKKVQGVNYVGGYAGSIRSGSVADVNTNTDDSLFQGILDSVISTPASLVSVLNATVSTVRYAKITVVDPDWGFTVGGWTDDANPANPIHYVPLCAGGFVGAMEGAIIGNNRRTVTVTAGGEGEDDTYSVSDPDITVSNIFVNGLRGVEGQYYAGGFVGIASEGSAASVADNKANILRLAQLENISILDIFRPYIYNADVNGVDEGFAVFTSGEESSGTMNSTRYSGCAGGFGGAVLDGHVQNSKVTKLSRVEGLNYVGGFIGHCGKGGIVDADAASLGDTATLLNAQAGIGDVIGSRVVSSSVTGISNGYTVQATGGSEPVAGGFVGFADLAKIGFKPATLTDPEQTLPCTAVNLKLVKSDQFAGGFIGKTTKGFLVDVQASSVLLEGLLTLVKYLLKLLYVPELQQGDGLNITILGNVLAIDVLDNGNLLGVTLLGIPIKVALSKASDTGDSTDVVKITIGDSYIELPCHYDETTVNVVIDSENPNLNIGLIPAFYTTVKNSTVTGISEGYDVFAGGADQENDGTHRSGFAGGFVGYNQLGEISSCSVKACDTVRGTPADRGEAVQKVGPFTGFYTDESNWNSNGQSSKETDDTYQYNNDDQPHSSADNNATAVRIAPFKTTAKLVLMDDAFVAPNPETLVPETADMQNPCLPTVDLTLHKVWDDMDGALGDRKDATDQSPVTVEFTVTRTARDAAGNVISGVAAETEKVTLTAADANPFTKNVWTKKLTGKDATGTRTVTENGTTTTQVIYYTYSVTEAAVKVNGTVTQTVYISGTEYADADVADKLSFSHSADGGYVAKIINQAPAEQTIVVDFGLPVQISVVEYLKKYGCTADEIAGIMPVSDLSKVSLYTTEYNNAEVPVSALDINNVEGEPTAQAHVENSTPRYGSFTVPAKVDQTPVTKLRYVPGSMMFDKPVEIAVALTTESGAYRYTKVKVVPATIIYYEAVDDFVDFDGPWVDAVANTAETGEQQEDRPGADVIDLDNIYGYDEQYASGTTYSLGNAKKVTVYKGNAMKPTAQFTFTGTGFDILAMTDNTTGYMRVELYRGDTTTGKSPIATWAVDTYYGCTREEVGYIRCLHTWDAEAEDWNVEKTTYPEMTAAQAAQKLNTTEDGVPVTDDPTDYLSSHDSYITYEKAYIRYLCVWDETTRVWRVAKTLAEMGTVGATENGAVVKAGFPDNNDSDYANHRSFIVYQENYVWTTNVTDPDSPRNSLYQVPVITSRGVKVKAENWSAQNPVYESMTYDTYTVVLKPLFSTFYTHLSAESYDLYFDGVRIYGPAQTDLDGTDLNTACYLQDHEGWPQFMEMRKLLISQNSYGETTSAAVFIDALGTSGGLADFKQYGPNNEIYLEPGQAIAFTLKKPAAAQVDQIHVSMKRVFAGEATVSFTSGPEGSERGTALTLNTASECYYDLSSVIRWNEDNQTGVIVIANSGSSGTVSLRNLKVTYAANPVPDPLPEGSDESLLEETYLVSVVTSNQPQNALDGLRLLNRAAALPIALDDDPAFLGASISLESDFSLHFYIPAALLADKTNPYVLFTKQTADGPVLVCQYDYVEELVGDTLCRRYSFRNLAASEMGTEVSARLFYNDQGMDHMSNVLTYSVKQYAMNMLEKTEDDALRTLLVDMLNYGAEAQKYFNVNADELVNAELTETQQACATEAEPALENHRALVSREGAKVWFEGCSLSLERNVTINYYLDLSTCGLSADELLLELTWKEADGSESTAVIDGTAFETRQLGGKTLYFAALEDLNAAQMRTVVSAVVRTKNDQACISDTMYYSIESYAQSKTKKDPALAALILAMMKYGDAAEAYFFIH